MDSSGGPRFPRRGSNTRLFLASPLRELAKKQGARRSPHWSTVRKAHLVLEPACQMCGGTEKLQVHHIHPFHLHPEHELEQDNLITLCEKRGHDCHFVMGHFHNWKLWNPSVRSDSTAYFSKSQEARKKV